MSNINSQRAGFAPELIGAVSASIVKLGTLLFSPVQIIFDNQGTGSVRIGIDPTGTNYWRTFPAGEALVLDMRGNHGIAPDFTADAGTSFYALGTGSTGNFSISYTYAKELGS